MQLPNFDELKEEHVYEGAEITVIDPATVATALDNVNGADWSQFKASLLMSPKAAALKVPSTSHNNPSSPSTSSSSSLSALKKRSVADEAEYLKNVKRRRPVQEESDKKKEQMYEAKTALAIASRESLLSEKQKADQLFELEKKKKEFEVQMMELQLLKMKKDLGLSED